MNNLQENVHLLTWRNQQFCKEWHIIAVMFCHVSGSSEYEDKCYI